MTDAVNGYLDGIRVLETGNEIGEYCGRILAGLGADVVRVEPPGGSATRRIGPFADDQPDPEGSLYFWQYNFGKRSVVIDLQTPEGRERFEGLTERADVLIDSSGRHDLDDAGVGWTQLAQRNPRLIYLRMSAFGDAGPWADFEGSDLVHLALGGVAMNCGYDPDLQGIYDTPPVAPQMWQSYQITGELASMAVMAALFDRDRSGHGQRLDISVHQAVSQSTENDVPNWIFLRQVHKRLTCRHSVVVPGEPVLTQTKDGRYQYPYSTYLMGTADPWDGTIDLLRKYGMASDLGDPGQWPAERRRSRLGQERLLDQIRRLILRTRNEDEVWREAQSRALAWAPVRRPEENVDDEHWQVRETFFEVEHPERSRSYTYVGSRWFSRQASWRRGPRPPRVGEHDGIIDSEWSTATARALAYSPERATAAPATRDGRPFPLAGVRVVDLGWMLASAGGGRFLAAFGAEVIKIEHASRPDGMRFGRGTYPEGGRAARLAATEPLPSPPNPGLNHSGSFMTINTGKLSMALNLKSERGRRLLEDMIRQADVVTEGYSPGTMERMGFGYERLKALNPTIVYVQQSGMGQVGTYGSMRAYGPTAQAISGLSEMSGLPEPYPPAGIGYSFLDWLGAYNMAMAVLGALIRRNATGEPCHIDASQSEIGLYLSGTATLDKSVNDRDWHRYGNRSPYKPAAPCGIYPTVGTDRWIAISVFTDPQWRNLLDVLGRPELDSEPGWSSLSGRLKRQDDLDAEISKETVRWDGRNLMNLLQRRGIPAGVCQTAEDRCDIDPQLAHDNWLVELKQSTIETWPFISFPVSFSRSAVYTGGPFDRSGPTYGEDTEYVLRNVLGLGDAAIAQAIAEAG